jgi:hypothetical protein
VSPDRAPNWWRPVRRITWVAALVGLSAAYLTRPDRNAWMLPVAAVALVAVMPSLLSAQWWRSLNPHWHEPLPPGTTGVLPQLATVGHHTVTLTARGRTPIQVIKVIRDLTGASLRDAKDAIDNVPSTLFLGLNEARAAEIAGRLRSAGAEVHVTVDDQEPPAPHT